MKLISLAAHADSPTTYKIELDEYEMADVRNIVLAAPGTPAEVVAFFENLPAPETVAENAKSLNP